MASAATNAVGTRFKKETTYGTAASGAGFQEFRYTSSSLIHNKETKLSETITANRLRDYLAEVAANAEGDMGWELAYGTEADIILSHALFSDIETATISGSITITQDTPDANSATLATANFAALKVGAYVRVKGYSNANNNGVFKVISKSGTQCVIDNANATTEPGTGNEEVRMKMIRNGNTDIITDPFSLTIEQWYSDIDQYLYFRGMRINELSLNVASQEIVTASISMMGLEGITGQTSTGSPTAAPSTSPMNATTNVGSIKEGGVALTTGVRSLALTINNNLRTSYQIGARFPRAVLPGFSDVSGTLEMYFEDLTMYNKFLAHTSSSYQNRFTDPDGNVIVITIPRLQFATGAPSVPGGNEDVILPMEFTALRDITVDAADPHSIQIDLLAP